MSRSLALFAVITLGLIFPQGHVFTPFIRYALMGLLFFAFLDAKFDRNSLNRSHLKILGANILLGLLAFALLHPFSPTLALTAFVTGIMPTAAVAPAMAGFLHRKVDFLTTSVVLNTLSIALVVPFILPLIIPVQQDITVLSVLAPVFSTIFIPLVLAQAVVLWAPKIRMAFARISWMAFVLFLLNLYIASAKASQFLRYEQQSGFALILAIAFVSLLVCLLNFSLGYWLGSPDHAPEASLALGRKNTIFGIWIALTFISPVVALGPMLYILWHNLVNAWEMYRGKR